MPQIRIPDSEVPIPAGKAFGELMQLIRSNAPDFIPSPVDRDTVFEGWQALCRRFGPVFVEKSPHHLHQRSALELMLEATQRLPEIDFRFVGLVRNPMDVLYSMWSRWRTDTDVYQHHWRLAHENLRWLELQLPAAVRVVRYEDLATGQRAVRELFDFLDLPCSAEAQGFIHAGSLARWRQDPWFAFQLDPDVARLAHCFGYEPADLRNESGPLWPAYRTLARLAYQVGRRPEQKLRRLARSALAARAR